MTFVLHSKLFERLSLINKKGVLAKRSVQTTCLFEFHKKRQAKMAVFANFMMPIVYKNQSIEFEHIQTRKSASAFDVSHMMQTIIRGRDRCAFLEKLTPSDVEGLSLNKCTLSMFLNESGGIIDDCIIGKRSDHIHLVSNASNADTVWSWLNQNIKTQEVELERLVDRGLIALQGPEAAQVLQSKVDVDLAELKFMNTTDASIEGAGVCQITRCGYTGEDGFEISVNSGKAEDLMTMLCKHESVRPAGLGARDTLRLEAGLCLHGHDISEKTTPVEASLGWTIQKRRRVDGNFLGSNVVLEQLKNGTALQRVGLIAANGGPPARERSKITNAEGDELGTVTSGTLSPSLKKNIAMGYLLADVSKTSSFSMYCDIRGKKFEYQLALMPFVKTHYYSKK